MFKTANLGDISPTISKAIDEDTNEKVDNLITQDLTSGSGEEKHGNILTDRDARHMPLQLYRHYADCQREFESRDDIPGLYDAQREQMTVEPYSNLSDSKLDSQRALRRANVFAVFFLITTDILGPYNAPYAIAQMGYVPGTILYILFGVFAAVGGALLNYLYCKLDSNNYPIRTFSDLAGRAVAPWFRYPTALLQFIQMIMNVGLILLSTGQSVAQMLVTLRGHNTLCFTVEILVWALFGMLIGQIRSLYRFAYLANSAIWMNVTCIIIIMAGSATQNTPNYKLLWSNYGCVSPYDTLKIEKHAIAGGELSSKISGMTNMVFAWGGATVFAETMAELKRPMDFWKGMLCAQCFIMVVYLFYGLFVYSYLGQWAYVTSNMALTSDALQTITNILNVISGMLAAALYANVGIKVLYQGFLVADFNFPALTTRKGAFVWSGIVVVYWLVAYIIGAAIPGISSLTSIIGAFCIFQFSYTLPFLFSLCYLFREDACCEDQFFLESATVEQVDTYANYSRWKRGMFNGGRKRSLIKLAALLLFLASLACAGLCAYSAIESAIDYYKESTTAAFSCTAPVTVLEGYTCAGITVE